MTDLRFQRIGQQMTIDVLNGARYPIERALREGLVALVHDPYCKLPDGKRHDMHYIRLSRRQTGAYSVEFISRDDAVRLSKATGVEIEVVGREKHYGAADAAREVPDYVRHPYDELPNAVPDGFEISISHFNSLPVIGHDVKSVPNNGFWARRFEVSDAIFISHDGEWIERGVEFAEAEAA